MIQSPGSWRDEFHTALSSWDGRYIVTSSDVDGFLSAAAICHHTRNSDTPAVIIGIYTTRHLVLFDNHSFQDARDAIWLDHDITQRDIICLGQHLLRVNPDDEIPTRNENSFNPNMWWPNLSYSNCFNGTNHPGVDKFPFATIHYIMAGLNLPEPERGTIGYSLLAHADSAWASGYNYNPNCRVWLEAMFDETNRIVNEISTQTYCDAATRSVHGRLVRRLLSLGIRPKSAATRRRPNIPSNWAVIQGNQSLTFKINSNRQVWMNRFQQVWSYILDSMGWKASTPSEITSVTSGEYNRDYPDRIEDLDELLLHEEVFSHAVTSQTEIKYTTNLRI